MALTDTTTLDPIISEVYNPYLSKLTFFNSYMLQVPGAAEADGDVPKGLFPVVPSQKGKNHRWPVEAATGAAVALAEGQAWPAPGNNTYLQAYIPYSVGYYARTVEITGQAIDAAMGEAEIIAALDGELVSAHKAFEDALNLAALGTGAMGIQLAIDSAGTYAGINRSTYSAWGAHETALGGAMSRSAMRDEVEALLDNDRGARHGDLVIGCPVNQISNIHALGGAGAGVPLNTAGGQHLDLGYTGQSFEGIPIIGIPDMTDTVLLVVHRPSCAWVMHKAPEVIKIQTGRYSYGYALVGSFIFVVKQPNLCAKVTGITA